MTVSRSIRTRFAVHRPSCVEGVIFRHKTEGTRAHAWCLACEGPKCPVCLGTELPQPDPPPGAAAGACAAEGCQWEKRTSGRWCDAHEKRAWRLGSPTARKCVACGDVVDVRALDSQLGTDRFRCTACLVKEDDLPDQGGSVERPRRVPPPPVPAAPLIKPTKRRGLRCPLSEPQARALEGRRRAARRGVAAGPVPFGYRRGRDGRFEPDPVEGAVVQFLFAAYARGGSIGATLKALAEEGFVTRSGTPWSRAGVAWILKSRTYRGEIRFGGSIVKRWAHAPLVSAALFRKVQRKLAANDPEIRRPD